MKVPEISFSDRALNPNFLHRARSYTFESGLPGYGNFTLDYTTGDKLIKVGRAQQPYRPPARTRDIHYPYKEQVVQKNPYILLVETHIGDVNGVNVDADNWPIFVVSSSQSIGEITHFQHSSTLKRNGENFGFIQNGILNRGEIGAVDLSMDGVVSERDVYNQLPSTMSDKNKGRLYRSLILATWAVECFKPAEI